MFFVYRIAAIGIQLSVPKTFQRFRNLPIPTDDDDYNNCDGSNEYQHQHDCNDYSNTQRSTCTCTYTDYKHRKQTPFSSMPFSFARKSRE